MKEILGISSYLPYSHLEFVGVLLFEVYPSTIVFKDENSKPVIKEWVDCSDDNNVNRYLYYRTDRVNLKRFINGEISHLGLITKSEAQLYIQDEKSENDILTTKRVLSKRLPDSYLPKSDFYFDFNFGVDTDEVINAFNLHEIEEKEAKIPAIVKDVATHNNSETIYIHFQEGKGVGKGVIRTDVFSNALYFIDELYRNVALDYSKTKERGDIKRGNQTFAEITSTEIFGQAIAASYGFMIRPTTNFIDQFDITPTNTIIHRAINLITNSKNSELLKAEYVSHSKYTMIAYRNFLSEVYKKELSLDLNWFSPKKLIEINTDMDYITANRVMIEIENLSVVSVAAIDIKGRFRALNCDTLHFVFEGTAGDLYKGHFDENSSEGVNQINFLQIYNITIKQTVEKKSGMPERTINLITKCELDGKQ